MMDEKRSWFRDAGVRSAVLGCGLTLAYFTLWYLPRQNALVAKALYHDDYHLGLSHWRTLLPQGPSAFWGQWRPVALAEFRFWELLLGRDWFWGDFPKIYAGVLLSAVCVALGLLLRRWGVSTATSLLVPALFVSHPIVNELSLWNTTHLLPVLLLVIVVGYVAIGDGASPGRNALGLACLTAGVLGYQPYLMVFATLLAGEILFRLVAGRLRGLRWVVVKAVVLLLAAVLYVSYMLISMHGFGLSNPRGFAEIASLGGFLAQKLHGVANMIVNVPMPIIAYHLGIGTAWKTWSLAILAPSAVALAAAILAGKNRTSRLAAAVASPLLILLPTGFLFVVSQAPESWRVALPSLVGMCVALGLPSALMAGVNGRAWLRALGIGLLLVVLIAEISVTRAHANRMVAGYLNDKELLRQVRERRSQGGSFANGAAIGVIRIPGIGPDRAGSQERAITVSYRRIEPRSVFDFEWAWRGFLVLNGESVKELELPGDEEFSSRVTELCRQKPDECAFGLRGVLMERCLKQPDFVQAATGTRVVYDGVSGVTAICRPKFR